MKTPEQKFEGLWKMKYETHQRGLYFEAFKDGIVYATGVGSDHIDELIELMDMANNAIKEGLKK